MGREIERKYLVVKEKWAAFSKPAGTYYCQGYILTDPEKTLRIRIAESRAFLTLKGKNTGATRSQYEYPIPLQDAREMMGLFAEAQLTKTRYSIYFAGKKWEVDEFEGENLGLVVAEIELHHEKENFRLPEWVGKEVTGDEKYYNSNIANHPYLSWPPEYKEVSC